MQRYSNVQKITSCTTTFKSGWNDIFRFPFLNLQHKSMVSLEQQNNQTTKNSHFIQNIFENLNVSVSLTNKEKRVEVYLHELHWESYMVKLKPTLLNQMVRPIYQDVHHLSTTKVWFALNKLQFHKNTVTWQIAIKSDSLRCALAFFNKDDNLHIHRTQLII